MTYESPKPTCPRCHSEVEATWDWCHACGYDPDGLRAAAEAQAAGAPNALPVPAPRAPVAQPPLAPPVSTAAAEAWSNYPGGGGGPSAAAVRAATARDAERRRSIYIVGTVGLLAVLVLVGVVARHKSPPPLTVAELTPTTHAGPEWVTLTDPTYHFAVDLPGQWTESAPPDSPEHQHDYVYESTSVYNPGQYALSVGQVALPVPFGWEQTLLTQSAEGLAAGGLTKSELGSFSGHNALFVEGTLGDGTAIKGVLFFDKQNLYVLFAGTKADPDDVARFLASFHFTTDS